MSSGRLQVVVPARAAEHDEVEGFAGLAVTAAVEAMPAGLPDEAGIGAAPRSMAKAASLVSRSWFSPAVIRGWPATSAPTPFAARRAGLIVAVRSSSSSSRSVISMVSC